MSAVEFSVNEWKPTRSVMLHCRLHVCTACRYAVTRLSATWASSTNTVSTVYYKKKLRYVLCNRFNWNICNEIFVTCPWWSSSLNNKTMIWSSIESGTPLAIFWLILSYCFSEIYQHSTARPSTMLQISRPALLIFRAWKAYQHCSTAALS